MSLTRKFLSAMGIEEEKIEEIISAHTETVNALKEQRDGYKEDAEKLGTVEKKLKDAEKKLSDAQAKLEGAPEDAYKQKYEDEHKAFEAYKTEIVEKETRSKKENAYKEILKDANIPGKHYAKILKYSDIDGLEFDDKGELSNKLELLKSIKEEWGDHIEQTGTTGANVQNPPANSGKGKMTKDEIMQIKDRAERQKAMLENKDLFLQ